MAKPLTVDEIKIRCEQIGLEYIEHYRDKDKQQTRVKVRFQCGECLDIQASSIAKHARKNERYSSCKQRRRDLTNGVCLCEHCHKDFHNHYGYGDNTEEQYLEYKFNYENN